MSYTRIILVLGFLVGLSVLGAVALVLYARSDIGASALERLERDNPAWKGIGRYEAPVPLRPVRE